MILHIKDFLRKNKYMTVSEAIIKRIYNLICERNITINKLAMLSGLTQSTVRDIMTRY